ncbi:MAG: hypothetical protein ACI33P_14140 [Lysinibacillus sp.]
MKILNGRYLVDGTERIIHLSEMDRNKYKRRFKGKLYCPTEGCPALLSFNGGKTPHFKTWRKRQHIDGCMYNVHRDIVGMEAGFLEDKTVTISGNRRQNALREAARLFMKTGQDEESREGRTSTRKKRAQTSKLGRKEDVQMTLYDGDLLEDDMSIKGGVIRKRFVDELKQKDAGQVRLVLGYVHHVIPRGEVADLYIQSNGAVLKAVFPEEFVKERLNSSYLNKFSSLLNAAEAGEALTFAGVGDVRTDGQGAWELVIYSGADFKINNQDLSIFAKRSPG